MMTVFITGLRPFLSSDNIRTGFSFCKRLGNRLTMQASTIPHSSPGVASTKSIQSVGAFPKKPNPNAGARSNEFSSNAAAASKKPSPNTGTVTNKPISNAAAASKKPSPNTGAVSKKPNSNAGAAPKTKTLTSSAGKAPKKTSPSAGVSAKTSSTSGTKKGSSTKPKTEKKGGQAKKGSSRPSSDLAAFREEFAKAKHIVVLTGAGVSAESGVPTFRGAGGLWRKWRAQELASPEAFAKNPSLVWEFYHHRREVMATKCPNPAHKAIAEVEKRLAAQDRKVVVITQNIDELHKAAGSDDILELHGSLFRVRCTKCGEVTVNRDSPICPALGGKGEPNPEAKDAKIPLEQLPRCKKDACGGLLRPNVIWFGESLNREVLKRAFHEVNICDLCLVVGTSSVVYPAAMFAPSAAEKGVTVAEFNIESTPATDQFGYMFQGPAGEWLPKALAPHPSEKK